MKLRLNSSGKSGDRSDQGFPRVKSRWRRKPHILPSNYTTGQEDECYSELVLYVSTEPWKNRSLSLSLNHSPHGLAAEPSEAAPVGRLLLETAEATEGANDDVVVEEAGEDGNRSPDSISVTGGKCRIRRTLKRITHVYTFCLFFKSLVSI